MNVRMGEPHNNKRHALLYPALVCWASGGSENIFETSKLVVDRLGDVCTRYCFNEFDTNHCPSARTPLCVYLCLSLLSLSLCRALLCGQFFYRILGFWSGATASQWSGCWNGTIRSRPSARVPRRAPGRTWTGWTCFSSRNPKSNPITLRGEDFLFSSALEQATCFWRSHSEAQEAAQHLGGLHMPKVVLQALLKE